MIQLAGLRLAPSKVLPERLRQLLLARLVLLCHAPKLAPPRRGGKKVDAAKPLGHSAAFSVKVLP